MNPNSNGNRAVTLAVDLNGRLAPSTEEIGSRIRFLRRQRKLTLEELAASSGITKSYLSKIERGISVPSISTALKVAGAFSITISQLLGEEQADEAICVVRKAERKHFMRDGSEQGYNYEMLAAPKRFKNMEPFIMHPPREFQGNRFFEHPGEEFILVLSGVVEIEFVNRRIELEAGDAIYFDAHLPHRSRSLGGKPAEAMVVVMG